MADQKKNFREQLAPMALKLKDRRSIIRPISQVALSLNPTDGVDLFDKTVRIVLNWIGNRAGKKLPEEAWRRESFELTDIGAQHAAAIALPELHYWSARLDDADKTIPLRTWTTEIGIALHEDGQVLLGARIVSSTRGEDAEFNRSVPGFIQEILRTSIAELDGELIQEKPRFVTTEDDVDWLVRLLENPARKSDVLLISTGENSSEKSDILVSAKTVHEKVRSVAHVAVISGPACYLLTNRIGKDLSVFRQGIRTYRHGFKSWIDDPSRHPLALSQKIQSWSSEGPKAFEQWLINQVLANSNYTTDREDLLPSFNTVRQLAAQANRESLKRSGASDTELIALYEEENAQLNINLLEQKELYDGLLAQADLDRIEAIQAADEAKTQSLYRLSSIRLLQEKLSSSRVEIPIPETLDGFDAWYEEHLQGKVQLVPRAFSALSKSEFHDPTLIYKALLVLKDKYVPMKLEGGMEKKRAYDEALSEIHLEDSATGDGINFYESLYSVSYRGRKRALDRHLKGNNARDKKFGFRLYFFWDEEEELVVVGSLPSHLDNRGS